MPMFETTEKRAQLVIGLLGIGLAIALWPYTTGLIGAPVLYVLFDPVHRWTARWIKPALSAGIVVALAAILIIGPGLSIATLVVNEAQQMAGGLIRSSAFGRLQELEIAGYALGPRLVGLGETAVSWIGSSAFDLVGTATRVALNLTIAMFGMYYLLLHSEHTWRSVAPYIPFSASNTARLRSRFRDVTNSTLIGTGLTAVVQGTLVGAAFAVAGLSNAFFWGVVTAVFAILPVVGSGLIWGPGAIALFLDERLGAAIGIALWGLVVVASVDNVIRPIVYNKWARIHPLITLVGALAGIRYFGILGLLIGPLALSYFFELIVMFRDEYIGDDEAEREDAVSGAGRDTSAPGKAAAGAAAAEAGTAEAGA